MPGTSMPEFKDCGGRNTEKTMGVPVDAEKCLYFLTTPSKQRCSSTSSNGKGDFDMGIFYTVKKRQLTSKIAESIQRSPHHLFRTLIPAIYMAFKQEIVSENVRDARLEHSPTPSDDFSWFVKPPPYIPEFFQKRPRWPEEQKIRDILEKKKRKLDEENTIDYETFETNEMINATFDVDMTDARDLHEFDTALMKKSVEKVEQQSSAAKISEKNSSTRSTSNASISHNNLDILSLKSTAETNALKIVNENHVSNDENDKEEEYDVERILDKRFDGIKMFYKVRWHGYTPEYDTWEPEENLVNAMDKVHYFENTSNLAFNWRKNPERQVCLSVC